LAYNEYYSYLLIRKFRAAGSESKKDITDVADVGTGTLYNFFDSKMNLLGAVLDDEFANLAVSGQAIAAAPAVDIGIIINLRAVEAPAGERD
jgi:AcrR family transcriptional regulator